MAAGGAGLGVRRLVPELLDGLPFDDPRAVRSRGDLRRINVVMRQAGIADDLLARCNDLPRDRPLRLLELGCGDGHGMLRIARRLVRRHPGAEITLLDRLPTVPDGTLAAFEALGWTVRVVVADVFDWLAGTDGRFDVAVANLFLHHFDDRDLARLMRAVAARARFLVATEPLRTGPSLLASRLVGAIGANDVSRHDAPASVRAGFRGRELGALWAPDLGPVIVEETRMPFTHAFVARSKRSPDGETA